MHLLSLEDPKHLFRQPLHLRGSPLLQVENGHLQRSERGVVGDSVHGEISPDLKALEEEGAASNRPEETAK